MKQLPVGAPAPDFSLQLLNGQVFRLSEQLRIGPVVLAFFKISCPTCQFTLPYLQRIYSELGERSKYRIVGVSQDDLSETRSFADHFGIKFDVAIDEHPYNVSSDYGFEYVPSIFIVGTDGNIQLSDYGFSKATLSEIADPMQLFEAGDNMPATRPG